MKVIGLLGGMSWESTAEYYKAINQGVKNRLGGLNSAKIVLSSVNFAEIEELQRGGDWNSAAKILISSAQNIEKAGAQCLVICTNTMHKLADEVAGSINIPLLHIADATATQVKAKNIQRIGLIGTKFTMEEEFYRGRLENKFGLNVIIPNQADRQEVHQIIFNELCKGIITNESREKYKKIIKSLADSGSEGVILGCTEISLLITQSDSVLPIFDTTQIHAKAAIDFSLA